MLSFHRKHRNYITDPIGLRYFLLRSKSIEYEASCSFSFYYPDLPTWVLTCVGLDPYQTLQGHQALGIAPAKQTRFYPPRLPTRWIFAILSY